MIIVATAADSTKDYHESLKRQVARAGLTFVHHELKPFTWRRMVEWEFELASAHAGDTIVFVDASDFLFVGSAGDLEALLAPQPLLFHSEAVCWPEPHKADFYPEAPTRFRYVNGTGPAGQGAAIASAIEFGMRQFPIRGDESSMFADNDQRFWTDVFLSGRGRIDYDCRLSVSLNAVDPDEWFVTPDRRLELKSGVRPLFVHANGYSRIKYRTRLKRLA